ncbi:SWR1-complex protein 4 [Nymphaea colorata]|nr:SWR1-complex protein 4 [Nymphaea colorata]
MADAKDILGIPKTGFPAVQEKKPRPPKEPQRKPDGVSREVYALTGGMPPLMPTIDVSHLKRRAPVDREKITWQWLPFTSSARKDNLQLFHWVKVANGVPPTGDYAFAKYNKHVDIIKYTDEEYEKYLTDPDWTKEETDQLFDLCEQFDLRFIVVADRFPTSRSVEELKSRYYAVSRALVIAKAPNAGDVSGHPLVKDPYNVNQEVERKRALSTVLTQTKQLERKNVESVEELGADGAVEKVGGAVDSISPSSNIHPAIISSAAADIGPIPASLRMLRVYLRSYALEQMVQAASSSAGLRTLKRVEQTLQDLGVNIKPKVPTKAVCAEHLELRKEILMLLNLQKQLQNKEAEASASRDSPYGDVATPSTPKRSHRGGDQPFQQDSIGFTGERVGKREHKRKILGRYSDGPPSPPQSKRARKMKASDG